MVAMLERLQSDLKDSMLARDSARTMVLRSAIAAFRNEAVAKGLGPQGSLSDAEAVQVMKRLIKSREDSAEQFANAGREDKAQVERAEIDALKAYMPAMLEGAALEEAVRAAVADVGAKSRKDTGLVMKAMQTAHGGRYDGRAANQFLQTLLP
jgi:uncharacterized protein YqeY